MNSVKVLQIPSPFQPELILYNFVVQSGQIAYITQSSTAKGFCSLYPFNGFSSNVLVTRQIPSVPPRKIPTCRKYGASLTVGFLDMTGKELPIIPKLLSMHHNSSLTQHERLHGGYLELRQQNAGYKTGGHVFIALALTPGVPKGSYYEPVILYLPWQELSHEAWDR